MGTSNFRGCGRFGYCVYVYEYDEDFYNEEYPELSKEEKYEIAVDDSYWIYQNVAEDVDKLIEDFNYDLRFFKLGLADGHYEGIEVILEEEPWSEGIEDLESILLNGDNVPYWVDGVKMTPKHKRNIERLFDDECDKIEDFLHMLCDEHGFQMLGVVAHFSNGETWYGRESRPQYEPYQGDNGMAAFFNQSRKPKKKIASRTMKPKARPKKKAVGKPAVKRTAARRK